MSSSTNQIADTIENVKDYREYKTNMNKFISKLDEILYRFDMVDIDRLEQFLINLIETYDFSKKEEDKSEENGYSNLSDFDVEQLVKDPKYTEMITYISINSDDINTLLKNLNVLFNNSIEKYINTDTDTNTNTNTNISQDFYKQKQDIIEKIEKIYKALEKRNNPEKFEALPFEKLNFYNVELINKNNFRYKIKHLYRKIINNKLHFVNNEDPELNDLILETFKYEFYNIYIELHEKFKVKLEVLKINIEDIIDEIKTKFVPIQLATQ